MPKFVFNFEEYSPTIFSRRWFGKANPPNNGEQPGGNGEHKSAEMDYINPGGCYTKNVCGIIVVVFVTEFVGSDFASFAFRSTSTVTIQSTSTFTSR